MTRDQFAALLNDIQAAEREVRVAGQKEYVHDDANAFGNFERISRQLGIPREKILWVYLIKHMDGILAYLNGHKSQREDIRGRIKDARMYLALLWGMIEERMPEELDELAFIDTPIRTPCPGCYSTVEPLFNGAICGQCKRDRESAFGPEIHGDPQYTRPGESEE